MWKGPLFLLISVIGAGGFAPFMRFAQTRRCEMVVVGVANYIAASAVMLLACFLNGVRPWGSSPYVILGLMMGASYVAVWVMLEVTLHRSGVSISSMVAQLSVLVPVLVSIFIFLERPGPVRIAGIILGGLCLPIIGTRVRGEGLRSGGYSILWLFGLFLICGLIGSLVKAFRELAPAEDFFPFMLAAFAGAAIGTALLLLHRRVRVVRRDLLYGIPLGMLNCLALFGMLFALKELDGSLVFPVRAAASLLLTFGVAFLLFGERLRGRSLMAIPLAVVALVLMNLGK